MLRHGLVRALRRAIHEAAPARSRSRIACLLTLVSAPPSPPPPPPPPGVSEAASRAAAWAFVLLSLMVASLGSRSRRIAERRTPARQPQPYHRSKSRETCHGSMRRQASHPLTKPHRSRKFDTVKLLLTRPQAHGHSSSASFLPHLFDVSATTML